MGNVSRPFSLLTTHFFISLPMYMTFTAGWGIFAGKKA